VTAPYRLFLHISTRVVPALYLEYKARRSDPIGYLLITTVILKQDEPDSCIYVFDLDYEIYEALNL
jgi:hypothetical protein